MNAGLREYLATEWNDLADKLEAVAAISQRHADSMRRRAEHAREQAQLAEADRG